jgi:hypothetical protein
MGRRLVSLVMDVCACPAPERDLCPDYRSWGYQPGTSGEDRPLCSACEGHGGQQSTAQRGNYTQHGEADGTLHWVTSLDDYEPYEHTVPEWTAGQLRAALATLPDGAPVRVAIPHELTSCGPNDDQDARYVVTGTSGADPRYDTLLSDDQVVILIVDYPSGTYVRRTGPAD